MLKKICQRRSRRTSSYDIPEGYASVTVLPAALPGAGRVLTRRGWAGKNVAFLNIL